VVDNGFLSAEFIWRKFGGHGSIRYSQPFWLGMSFALLFVHRLKSVSMKAKPVEAGWKTGGRISWCAENFSAVREHCPPEKPFAIRHSLLAAVLPFATSHSLSFSDLPICRPHDLPI